MDTNTVKKLPVKPVNMKKRVGYVYNYRFANYLVLYRDANET